MIISSKIKVLDLFSGIGGFSSGAMKTQKEQSE
jgi:site-specific DNA-cytosine methylase